MPSRKEILRKLDSIEWDFAPHDLVAARSMAERICRQGRVGGLIPYSNLVSGISFTLPNVNGGMPFLIDTDGFTGINRRILGDLLGFISSASFRAADFWASSLVVSLTEYQPSDVFFNWMEDLNILPDTKEKTVEEYWIAQVSKAEAWYKANPKGFPL